MFRNEKFPHGTTCSGQKEAVSSACPAAALRTYSLGETPVMRRKLRLNTERDENPLSAATSDSSQRPDLLMSQIL